MWNKLFGSLVKPVAGVFQKREERKLAKETLKGKAAQAKIDGEFAVTLTDAEWESIAAKGMNDSWKDEYITLSVASILNMIVIGALLQAFGFEAGGQVLQGVGEAVIVLSEMGVDFGFLLKAVVLAAIGLKVWRA